MQESEVKAMFPDDVKSYTAENREGTYTLLDVRQPVEYELARLPGARLIPLPLLADSLHEIDSRKPTIVYCAVGGRSRMAAQLLKSQGFEEVYHLEGGIEAWEEPTASGPREFHLKFVRGDETPREIILLAYGMEERLKQLHRTVQGRTSDPDLADLLERLVRAEESHERTLLDFLGRLGPSPVENGLEAPKPENENIMEGGIDINEFMSQNEPFMNSVRGYLDLAMMVETQALDLYLRMADVSKDEGTRKVLLHIGDEEKAHLSALARLLEEKVG